MKKSPLLAAVAAMLLLAAGCSTTQIGTYADVQDSYIATVDTLLEARNTGAISEDEWQEIVLPAILLGDSALDEWLVAIDHNDDASAHDYARTVLAVLQSLQPYVADLE